MQRYQEFLFTIAPRIEKASGVKIVKELNPAAVDTYKGIGGYPFLDGEYTVFGKVIKGLEVIDKIAQQPMDDKDRPVSDIKMTVTVKEMTRSEITKQFGYQYN
jgi:cyclophilin family peptidyl-prolyl cis-trans isomerase